MKKAIALALCIVLALSLCVPACAEYTVEDFVAELQAEDLGYDYYEVKLEGDIVCVCVSMDGMSDEAAAAKEDENLDNWNIITAKMDELSLSLQEKADEHFADLETRVVLFNDLDSAKMLYLSADGECLYDWVTYTVEDYAEELRQVENDWDYYDVELSSGILCLYFASNGTAETAIEAKDSQDFTAWDEITAGFDEISIAAQEEANSYFDDLSTCIYLVNDTNTDNVLYMVYDGVCLYDWVRDYDITVEEEAAA